MEDRVYSNRRLTIKEWGVQDRPREKYREYGAGVLSDAELISILFRTGNASESAVELAKKVLSMSDNSLNILSKKTLQDLMQIKGVGYAKAVTLLSAFEIGKRVKSESVELNGRISTCTDVVNLMQDKIAFIDHEEFWVIYLTPANKIVSVKQLSKGGITNTSVDVRIILHDAILMKATGIIVCHNHPSGTMYPSEADVNITKKLKESAKVMDITLLDHVIIYRTQYFSFAESGRL